MAQQQVKKKKRKVKNSRIASFTAFVLSLCFFGASGYFIYRTVTEVFTTVNLSQELAVNEEVLASLKSETESLENEKVKLEDPKYVSRYARGQYLLTKDGEKIFYLQSKD